MKNKKRIIVVLGVYRSGTSALTKSLETIGVRLSDPSQITFNSFNEKGDWEDILFSSFNRELIKALYSLEGRYRDMMPLTEKEVNFLCDQGFFARASRLLLERLSDSTPFAMKDPKFCTLLPFWKKVFKECGVQVSFVIALRNPLNVVASIDAAEKILGKYPHEKSFWIWISYILSCLEHTEGYERLLVDYGELVKHPAHQVERIARACQLEINDESLRVYCNDFMDRSLCHFHEKEDHLFEGSFCRAFAMEMYEALLCLAKDTSDFQKLESSLEKWREQFLSAESLLVLVEKKEYEAEELNRILQERERSIYSLREAVSQHLQTIAGCSNTIHQRNLQVATLMKEKANPSA